MQPGAASGVSVRLLVVDDCRTSRMLVAGVVRRWGIVPTLACDGAHAVDIVERREFDLILMDILMPVMDGIVATAKIRQFERENPWRAAVPIVAYTALDLPPGLAGLERVGLSAVLPKPCSSGTLQDCLVHWCAGRFRVH